MATAVLLGTVIFALCTSANSQNAATLTFSTTYPSRHENVSVYCNSAIVASRADLSELTFYTTDSNYKYTLKRNCATDEIAGSDIGFNNTVWWVEDADTKVHLEWSSLTTKYNSLQFQCSVTNCTSQETAASDSLNITVLPDPKKPGVALSSPYVNLNLTSSVIIYCSGFVGYPGGILELLVIEYRNGVFTEISLENFTAGVDGKAKGNVTYTITPANEVEIQNSSSKCIASNTLNKLVPQVMAYGEPFEAAYPPTAITVYYHGNQTATKTDDVHTIILTAPLKNEIIQCVCDKSVPTPGLSFTLTSDDHGVQVRPEFPAGSYSLNYPSSAANFRLRFACWYTYYSKSDPDLRTDLMDFIAVEVYSMAISMQVSYLLLLSALVIAWKL